VTDVSASTATDSLSREEPSERGDIAARYLVAFFFSTNACFAVYMFTQYFVWKTYGNELHTIYMTIVFTTTVLLALSTRRLWTERAREGTYLFFVALAVSLIGKIASELHA